MSDEKIAWYHWLWMAPIVALNWTVYSIAFVLQWLLAIVIFVLCLPALAYRLIKGTAPAASPSPAPSPRGTP